MELESRLAAQRFLEKSIEYNYPKVLVSQRQMQVNRITGTIIATGNSTNSVLLCLFLRMRFYVIR